MKLRTYKQPLCLDDGIGVVAMGSALLYIKYIAYVVHFDSDFSLTGEQSARI